MGGDAVMVEVAVAFQAARDGSTDAIGGPIDGRVQIRLGVLDHHVRLARNDHLYPAALVAAARGPFVSLSLTTTHLIWLWRALSEKPTRRFT